MKHVFALILTLYFMQSSLLFGSGFYGGGTSAGVSSFNGRIGAVSPETNDYLWSQINKSISSIDDITTRDHYLLDGLDADDHPQYCRADGTRPFTGETSWLFPYAKGDVYLGISPEIDAPALYSTKKFAIGADDDLYLKSLGTVFLAADGGTIDALYNKLTHLPSPIDGTDAANKAWVEGYAENTYEPILDTGSSGYLRYDKTWVTPADISQDGTTRKPTANMDWNNYGITKIREIRSSEDSYVSLNGNAIMSSANAGLAAMFGYNTLIYGENSTKIFSAGREQCSITDQETLLSANGQWQLSITDGSLYAQDSYVPNYDQDLATKYYVDANFAPASDLSDHVSATTSVHGIADTSSLATQTWVEDQNYLISESDPAFVAWKGSTPNLVAGANAGQSLTSGEHDTFIGVDSGKFTTTGNDNTGNGYRALYSNVTGIQNSASGCFALFSNTSNYNSAFGYFSLFNNTTGSQNAGFGTNSLFSNVGGHYNVGAGMNALYYNVNGSRNVGVGHSAGKYETGNNAFYVDNQDRTDTAGDKAKALLYGTFDALVANQQLTVNANTITLNGDATVKSVKNIATQITINGSAGTAICSEPEQGSSYKKSACYLSGFSNISDDYTFPISFGHAPYVYGDATVLAVATVITSKITFASAVTITGHIFVEGY